VLQHYQKYFYAVHANNPELKTLAYQLRYKVYSEEYGDNVFKAGNDLEIETDEYDDEACHCLLFHKPTDTPIGYIRLVPYNEKSKRLLPLEHICHNSFDKNLISLAELRTQKTGEVSRMAIESTFRRRAYDVSFQLRDKSSSVANNRRMKINYLPLCIALMGILSAQESKLSYSVALMEPRLAKLLKMFGIQLRQIGSEVEFHGLRAPFIHYPQGSDDRLRTEFRELYALIKEELNFTVGIPQFPVLDPIHQTNYKNAGKNESPRPATHTLRH
jgi:N-acyl amino acid synthase of PEP-CTERM/exosortase system